MLTPGLESAIQKGLAQYRTHTFGIGGSARIPVPKGSFIIITDFDYFYFIDNPDLTVEPSPAMSEFGFQFTEPITEVTWQLDGVPAVPPIILFDTSDPLQVQLDFQAFLDANFPGFTCSVMLIGLDQWLVTVTTTTPGTQYNGLVPVITYNPAPLLFSVTAFAGGADGATSLANITANATHQLEFRSTKSRNHYVIRENFEILRDLLAELIVEPPGQEIFQYNVKGYYHRDCYLVHTESVQITCIKVPPPEQWAGTVYLPPSPKSQENALPVGYGQAGGLNTVRQAQIQPFPAENINPLTSEFEDLVGASQDQLKFNTLAGRELSDPTSIVVALSNQLNYPVVNVGYVLFNKDYNDYVKQS